MKNVVKWFEIPVSNLERAISFYNTILKAEIETTKIGDFKMGIIPHEGVGGALIESPGYKAPEEATVVYMDGTEGTDTILIRVKSAGGVILEDRTEISGGYGFYGMFKDLDGNVIGIYEPQEIVE